MMSKIFGLFFWLFLLLNYGVSAQFIEVLTEGTKSSLRGLSVVDDQTVWVSGSNGTVGRSLDGGISWQWMRVKNFESYDFRDIEAFSRTGAVIMAVGSPSYILRTADGGNTWQVGFSDTASAMFLDAMEFWNEQSGVVIGDPINGRFFIARTFNGGKSWQPIPIIHLPEAIEGEACFAASGTNIRAINKQEVIFVSGGKRSALFNRNKVLTLPFIQGSESSGCNSIAIKNKKYFIVVGGDYLQKDAVGDNCFITTDGGRTWKLPTKSPVGYRSCVEYLLGKYWVTCGLSGVDLSSDDGMTWNSISDQSYHVVRKAKKGVAVYVAGTNGKVGKVNTGR